jgi:transposase
MRNGICFTVSAADRQRLRAVVADPKSPQKHVWRARIILLSDEGLGTSAIMAETGKSKTCVWRWQERFMHEGVGGLLRDKSRPPGKAPVPAERVAEIVRLTQQPPPHEATHWTLRAMAKVAGVAASTVQAIWKAHGLSPHRWRNFKLSNDPAFAEKLTDVVSLYVDPPAHAVVLSIDEKSQIQALDRTQPGLPMKKGRAGAQAHPRHPRQLRRAQEGQGPRLARPPSALDLPLHADLVFVAQRRRGLLRQAHAAQAQAWRLPFRRRPPSRHQPLRPRIQHREPATLRLESRSRCHHCCPKPRVPNVGINPLDSAMKMKRDLRLFYHYE